MLGSIALWLSASLSSCGTAGDIATNPHDLTAGTAAEFSIFTTYPTASDNPTNPDLAAHLTDVLGQDAQIRHITDLDGTRVYMARGDSQLCIATEGNHLSAGCGHISTPSETWVATASGDPGTTPYLLVAAPDGYTEGHIGTQTCQILSNLLIVLNPNLGDSVTLTGAGMTDAVFEGQSTGPEADDQDGNDCFPT